MPRSLGLGHYDGEGQRAGNRCGRFNRLDANSANKTDAAGIDPTRAIEDYCVRTNQDKVSDRVQPTAELDIFVPEGSSIEAHGRYGDFDVQNINGNVNINSDANAGVRLEILAAAVQRWERAITMPPGQHQRALELKGGR